MHIGFFDSGLGGKLVADYFSRLHPEYSIIIRNDAQNMPYGNKSEEVLRKLLEENIIALFNQGCALVIVACNTLSVRLVRVIQDELVQKKYSDRKVLGVVIPTVEVMDELPETKFLLLATESTVASQRYEDELKSRQAVKQVVSIPIPKLALLIEQGDMNTAQQVVDQVIGVSMDYEVIVLACTHYCVLKEYLRNRYLNKKVLSQDEIVAEKLQEYLVNHPEMHNQLRYGITDA
ncbi:MAG: aspartate/glutamate racemase family protein [bacterium]